jgi:hypothetical protein
MPFSGIFTSSTATPGIGHLTLRLIENDLSTGGVRQFGNDSDVDNGTESMGSNCTGNKTCLRAEEATRGRLSANNLTLAFRCRRVASIQNEKQNSRPNRFPKSGHSWIE